MCDLLAAVPWEAWVAGLLAAAIGGLAPLARRDDEVLDEGPENYPHGDGTAPELDELDGLDWDPRWDEEPRPGRGARGRTEAP